MRLVEVNGISLLGASHSQSVKALRMSEDLHIIVCKGFDMEEVMRRKSIADTLEDDTMSSVTVRSHGMCVCVFGVTRPLKQSICMSCT
jgi:protein scribble